MVIRREEKWRSGRTGSTLTPARLRLAGSRVWRLRAARWLSSILASSWIGHSQFGSLPPAVQRKLSSLKHEGIDVRAHSAEELFTSELPGVSRDILWIDFHVSQACDRLRDCFDGLLVEKNTRLASDDGFRRASATERYHWTSACHSFDRHHSKILLTREDQGAAARVMS